MSQNKRNSKTQGDPFVNTALINHPSNYRPRPELPPRPETTSDIPSLLVNHAPMSELPTKLDKGRPSPPGMLTSATRSNEEHPYKISGSGLPSSPSLAPLCSPRKNKSGEFLHMNTLSLNAPLGQDIDALTRKSHRLDINTRRGATLTELLDNSTTNRRPPCDTSCCQVINANYDGKVFDICAGRVCSAGQLTRVWNLTTGKLLLSLALGEREGKATAIAFKPAVKPDQEGSRLWIGTSYGNVHEVDIMRQRVVSSGLYPHTGRVVMSIHRFQNSMWTLDDDGTLQVWPPNSNGMPMLENRPITRKLPRGHSFSMVIRGILWVAVGREIQILRPSANDLGEFKITQQPYNQTGVGEITSGAVISDQLDKVYFGHSDGKITTYSIADYVCLGVVNASVYKINCLVGAGMHLWAGYNTGNICVYDVKSRPWKIIKEWHAHEGPVVNLSVDQSGLWISGRLRVGSVSLDNTIRIWDGLLEEDWLGLSMIAFLNLSLTLLQNLNCMITTRLGVISGKLKQSL